MASSGLVLLLLVLFSFLICSLSVPQLSDRQENRALQKRGKKLETAKTAGRYFVKIAVAFKPFIGLIPGVGSFLKLFIDLANIFAGKDPNKPVLDYLKKEFDNLNIKIDANQKNLEWQIWTNNGYAKLKKDIIVGFDTLVELKKNCPEPCIEKLKKNRQDNKIKTNFQKAEKYVKDLHYFIAGYNAETYEQLLKNHVRCHEDQMKSHTALNAWLSYAAISMTNFYNLFNNIKTNEDDLSNKAREISAAMFQIQKKCISEPDPYVELDIRERINESEKRKNLAVEIKKYLDKTFNRYDWMVVAFQTDKSNRKSRATKWRNRHILTGFTLVERGGTTVAFAKQAKGKHTRSEQVKQLLNKCFKKPVICFKVESTLVNCDEHINDFHVFEMCSAIHAYIHKEHGSVSTVDAGEDFKTEPQSGSHIYTGKCSISPGVNTGHFKVLIKSDEELMNEDPCKDVDCGGEQRGQCVPLENARIGLCECEPDYYGEKCDETIEEYKKSIFTKEIPKAS